MENIILSNHSSADLKLPSQRNSLLCVLKLLKLIYYNLLDQKCRYDYLYSFKYRFPGEFYFFEILSVKFLPTGNFTSKGQVEIQSVQHHVKSIRKIIYVWKVSLWYDGEIQSQHFSSLLYFYVCVFCITTYYPNMRPLRIFLFNTL